MNIQDITERYREDPEDPRVLANRKIDAIIHVTPANQKPDMALFKLIRMAVNKSKDPCIKSKHYFHVRHSCIFLFLSFVRSIETESD